MTKFNNLNVKRVKSNLKAGKKRGGGGVLVECESWSCELLVVSCEFLVESCD